MSQCSISLLAVVSQCSISLLAVVSQCSISLLAVVSQCSISLLAVMSQCSISLLAVMSQCSISLYVWSCFVSDLLAVVSQCSISLSRPVLVACSHARWRWVIQMFRPSIFSYFLHQHPKTFLNPPLLPLSLIT